MTGKLISNRIFLAINIICLLLSINLQYGYIKELNNSQWVLVFFPVIAFAPFILVVYFFIFKKLLPTIPNPDKSFIIINILILFYLSAVEYSYILTR